MKRKILLLSLCLIAFLFAFGLKAPLKSKDKVLVFSKTTGYRHTCIKEGIAAMQKLGVENNFDVEATEDAGEFTDENLKQYKALIFMNPTGTNIFNESEKAAFKKYINNGGGFVGIHSATDCSYEWEWYGKMVGGYFKSHPKIQEATLHVISKKHPSTRQLPDVWQHKDEWYNFKDFNKDVNVLIRIDEKSYKGGENGDFHPISWYHNYDGGRAFYTALGHTDEDFTSDKNFLNDVLGGIEYAMGRKK
jgi:uncharacterized protein